MDVGLVSGVGSPTARILAFIGGAIVACRVRTPATVVPVSSLMHPVGPEPPGVYWLRRIAFVMVILTFAMGAWWAIGSFLGKDSAPVATPAGTLSPSAAGSAGPSNPSGESSQAPSQAPTEEAGASAEPAATTNVKECVDSAILVEADTDEPRYPVESTPRLTMTITNTGDVACTRDVGTKANELEITSGGYHVWSSDDCATDSKSKIVTLQPQDTVASSLTWSGRLSKKGCTGGDTLAKAGRYDLVARNGEVRSEKAGFALTNPE